MKECVKQLCMMPLPNGKFSFTESGIISAQENGFKQGWKAALEWVLTQATSGIEEDGSISFCNHVSLDMIKEELGEIE